MSNVRHTFSALIERLLDGDGHATQSQRRAAFDNAGVEPALSGLLDKLTRRASTISDADIATARAAGLSEDQIFEIVVCGAVGQAARQHATALTALDAASGKE